MIRKNDIHIIQSIREIYDEIKEKVAVAFNLYYDDSLSRYSKYILNIPKQFDIYFFSSNPNILHELNAQYASCENIYIIKKENRGRDVSALLVAFRPYMEQYTYICFVHDKKQNYAYLEDDVNLWCENIWGNMLFSEGYIWNVIALMHNEMYGVLMPPKPIGKYLDTMYGDCWGSNFENVVSIADKLGVKADIDKTDTDILTIGTVFWCTTCAMKKLFEYDWKYEDFLDEPLPEDKTISHAIERILGFVALDAGYKIGTIMNPEYAAKVHEIMQQKLENIYCWMAKEKGVKNSHQLELLEIIEEAHKSGKKVYLYGAGKYGKLFLKKMELWGYMPSGFIVSDGRKEQDKYCGYRVCELSEIKNLKDIIIILTVSKELQSVIEDNLQQYEIYSFYRGILV